MRKLLFICFILFFSSCFSLFDKEQKTLTRIDIDEHCKIEANLIMTGATTKDVVQIVLVKDNNSKIIGTYESYDWVELIKMPNDSLLVKLSNSTSYLNHIDTQYIKLQKG
ncbi:MAG: hypothetical protein WCG87_04930 [Bacteroidota bacterium]